MQASAGLNIVDIAIWGRKTIVILGHYTFVLMLHTSAGITFVAMQALMLQASEGMNAVGFSRP